MNKIIRGNVACNVNFIWMIGNTENFQEPFRDSATDIRHIAVSFYSGIFSYAGWNYVLLF